MLTGATGVFGGHLVKEILMSRPKTHLWCLVRAEDVVRGRERLLDILRAYDPEGMLREAFEERVHPVLGDVAQERLGLQAVEYDELAERTDAVIHSAAITNLFLSYRRIEGTNVRGTANVIDFALATPSRYLVYISTYTVMGDKVFDPDVVFREADLDLGQGFDFMTYQRSKFEAELAVRSAGRERGLRWNIMRPGQIFGEARTGYYPQGQTNVSGLFYDIFKTIIESKVALYSETHFDVTPVDYVSRGALYLGFETGTYGQTYHLTNPDIKTYTAITRLLHQLGYDIEIVSQDEYRRMLFERGLQVDGVEYKSYTTKAFRWWFAREKFDFRRSCITDCAFTNGILRAAGVVCPPIDLDLIGTYVDTSVRLDYFPIAARAASMAQAAEGRIKGEGLR